MYLTVSYVCPARSVPCTANAAFNPKVAVENAHVERCAVVADTKAWHEQVTLRVQKYKSHVPALRNSRRCYDFGNWLALIEDVRLCAAVRHEKLVVRPSITRQRLVDGDCVLNVRTTIPIRALRLRCVLRGQRSGPEICTTERSRNENKNDANRTHFHPPFLV